MFYYLLKSVDHALLGDLELGGGADDYHFVNQGQAAVVATIDDKQDWDIFIAALKKEGFEQVFCF